MKKYWILLVVLLVFTLTACQSTPDADAAQDTADADTAQEEATEAADTQEADDENDDAQEADDDTTTAQETEPDYPDTWFDFSAADPIADDAGDAETNDITNVYAANDDYYIYVAFAVETDHIDSTTMVMGGGACIFVGIDDPGYFAVNDIDKNIFADTDGNGDYCGQATYKYEDGLLQIRMPLALYGGASEFSINTLMRANVGGGKIDADNVDDFVYTLVG